MKAFNKKFLAAALASALALGGYSATPASANGVGPNPTFFTNEYFATEGAPFSIRLTPTFSDTPSLWIDGARAFLNTTDCDALPTGLTFQEDGIPSGDTGTAQTYNIGGIPGVGSSGIYNICFDTDSKDGLTWNNIGTSEVVNITVGTEPRVITPEPVYTIDCQVGVGTTTSIDLDGLQTETVTVRIKGCAFHFVRNTPSDTIIDDLVGISTDVVYTLTIPVDTFGEASGYNGNFASPIGINKLLVFYNWAPVEPPSGPGFIEVSDTQISEGETFTVDMSNGSAGSAFALFLDDSLKFVSQATLMEISWDQLAYYVWASGGDLNYEGEGDGYDFQFRYYDIPPANLNSIDEFTNDDGYINVRFNTVTDCSINTQEIDIDNLNITLEELCLDNGNVNEALGEYTSDAFDDFGFVFGRTGATEIAHLTSDELLVNGVDGTYSYITRNVFSYAEGSLVDVVVKRIFIGNTLTWRLEVYEPGTYGTIAPVTSTMDLFIIGNLGSDSETTWDLSNGINYSYDQFDDPDPILIWKFNKPGTTVGDIDKANGEDEVTVDFDSASIAELSVIFLDYDNCATEQGILARVNEIAGNWNGFFNVDIAPVTACEEESPDYISADSDELREGGSFTVSIGDIPGEGGVSVFIDDILFGVDLGLFQGDDGSFASATWEVIRDFLIAQNSDLNSPYDLNTSHTLEFRVHLEMPIEDLWPNALGSYDDRVVFTWYPAGETPPAPPAPITMGINPIPAPVVDGVSGFKSGEVVTVTGFGLEGITKLLVGGIEVAVTGNSATGFTFTIPAGLAPGTYDITLIESKGTLTYGKALVIATKSSVTGTPPVVSPAPANATFAGFGIGRSQLTTKMKSEIRTWLNTHSTVGMMVEITGYTMGPRVLKSDTKLALDRARAVRDYIKSLKPAAQFKAMKSATLTTAGAQFRSAKVEISYNS